MKNYFHHGFGDQFMFRKLVIDDSVTMIAVCAVLFILAMGHEYIKSWRFVKSCSLGVVSSTSINRNNAVGGLSAGGEPSESDHIFDRSVNLQTRAIHTMVQMVQTTLGFVIMLAVMSFNICIIFAVILGKC